MRARLRIEVHSSTRRKSGSSDQGITHDAVTDSSGMVVVDRAGDGLCVAGASADKDVPRLTYLVNIPTSTACARPEPHTELQRRHRHFELPDRTDDVRLFP